jgi:hypothetical protein
MLKRKLVTKKLLVASIGVATVSYVACSNTETSGNLVAPPQDASADHRVTDAPTDTPFNGNETSGNLAPPPPDTGTDTGSGDASSDAPDGD